MRPLFSKKQYLGGGGETRLYSSEFGTSMMSSLMKIKTILQLFVRTCDIKLRSPPSGSRNETCGRMDTIAPTWAQFMHIAQIRHKYGKCKNKLGYVTD
jgi:hypothetical protein